MRWSGANPTSVGTEQEIKLLKPFDDHNIWWTAFLWMKVDILVFLNYILVFFFFNQRQITVVLSFLGLGLQFVPTRVCYTSLH